MTEGGIHPMATGHIPHYITAADGSDYLLTFMAVFTVIVVLLLGVAYFTLHAIPEKMAHENNHSQFQIVGILALLALFTHNNLFWVLAILVAGFRFPDYLSPIESIADSLGRMAKRQRQKTETPAGEQPADLSTHTKAEG